MLKIVLGGTIAWERLTTEEIVIHKRPAAIREGKILRAGDLGTGVAELQMELTRFGFDAPQSGSFCRDTAGIVSAFQRHYRPARIDGAADSSTRLTLAALLQKLA